MRLILVQQRGLGNNTPATKYCRTPSCPNLEENSGLVNSEAPCNRPNNVLSVRGGSSNSNNSMIVPRNVSGRIGVGMGNGQCLMKYTSSESPDTYTTGNGSSESSDSSVQMYNAIEHQHHQLQQNTCSHPAHHSHRNNSSSNDDEEVDAEVINNLKLRIEMQQRRIQALELANKGSNYLTNELERLQERLSSIEAQNIRLEANNIQLQLDNDLLRQGDGNERLQKRNKHLEE